MSRLEKIKKLHPQPVNEYLAPGLVYYHLKPEEFNYLIARVERLEAVLMDIRGYGRFDKENIEAEVNHIRKEARAALEDSHSSENPGDSVESS